MKDKVNSVYDFASFREIGHRLVDELYDHMVDMKEGRGTVLDLVDPEEEYNYWSQYEIEDPVDFFKTIISRNIRLHHRRYVGHQVSAPAPLSALAGLTSELLNEGMGIYEMGAAATAIERVVVKTFCKKVGYDPSLSDGVLSSGGTLANLISLLAARSVFRQRHRQQSSGYILVSEQAHFCIDRAAMTMGLDMDKVIKIETDPDYRIDTGSLESAVQEILNRGEHIMAIVACACTTATGSYDDLNAIADMCERHSIWMHVDGAHGGAALFSSKYRDVCSGVSRAQSVIIDAHKMMMTPALATAVLFQSSDDSYRALATEASYLFEHSDQEWHNLTKRTYETTKYMMSIKIFLIMKYHGLEAIDAFVTRQYDLTRRFADYVKTLPDFAIAHEPMSNILCFRYTGADKKSLDLINIDIRKLSVAEGRFYIVQTKLASTLYLRVTLMNPHTNLDDLIELIEHLRDLASQSVARLSPSGD